MPLTDSHDWRQADGYAIARNFHEVDNNIIYPRIDHFNHESSGTGISGSEFPFMNYLVSKMYLLTPVDWWQGRFLNLMFTSIGIYFFYLLLYKGFEFKYAFEATWVFLFSLGFIHARKFMPDMFSLSIGIASVYFGVTWLKQKGKFWNLLLFLFLCSLALLSKISSVVVFGLLIPFIFDHNNLNKKKYLIICAGILAVLPVYNWYFVWVPKLNLIDGRDYFYMGQSFKESMSSFVERPKETLMIFVYGLQFVAFLFFIVGTIRLFIDKIDRKLLFGIIISGLLMLGFIVKAGETFINLSYYIIPILPVMSILTVLGFTWIKRNWFQRVVLIVVMIECLLSHQHQFFYNDRDKDLLKLESVLDSFSTRDDLIAINGALNPEDLYYAHRKGWLVKTKQLQNQKFIEQLVSMNCKYVVIRKHVQKVDLNVSLIFEDTNFKIYQLIK